MAASEGTTLSLVWLCGRWLRLVGGCWREVNYTVIQLMHCECSRICQRPLVKGTNVGALWPSVLERWTCYRVVLGSNPAAATSLQNFGNSIHPALPVSFRGDAKSCRSLLSGVYARGSKRPHQSALEMCNLSWTPSPYIAITPSGVRVIIWVNLKNPQKSF